jgi:hypothetical protein
MTNSKLVCLAAGICLAVSVPTFSIAADDAKTVGRVRVATLHDGVASAFCGFSTRSNAATCP